MIFRRVVASIMLAAATVGCGHYGVSGADDLGLAARFNAQTLPIAMDVSDPRGQKARRNEILSTWIVKSDFLCADYQMQLSRAIRDSRLATDSVATVLSGLATIFANPAVIHPLAGAATIVMGVGGDVQSDLFLQQAGDVMVTAMQSVRTRARTKLEEKFTAEYPQYTLEQGLVDVQRYDRESCNLNVALNEIRALLNIVGPTLPTANNPIISLHSGPPAGSPAETAPAAPSPAAAPMATTIIPPTVQPTPSGGVLFTPGSVQSTPVLRPPAAAATGPTSALSASEQAVVTRAGGFAKFVALLGLDPARVTAPDRTFRNRIKLVQTCRSGGGAATGLVDQRLLDVLNSSRPDATHPIPGC